MRFQAHRCEKQGVQSGKVFCRIANLDGLKPWLSGESGSTRMVLTATSSAPRNVPRYTVPSLPRATNSSSARSSGWMRHASCMDSTSLCLECSCFSSARTRSSRICSAVVLRLCAYAFALAGEGGARSLPSSTWLPSRERAEANDASLAPSSPPPASAGVYSGELPRSLGIGTSSMSAVDSDVVDPARLSDEDPVADAADAARPEFRTTLPVP